MLIGVPANANSICGVIFTERKPSASEGKGLQNAFLRACCSDLQLAKQKRVEKRIKFKISLRIFTLLKNKRREIHFRHSLFSYYVACVFRCAVLYRAKKEKTEVFTSVFLCQHRPIFPGRFQPSIVGTNELNFRVRDGNGWTLAVKDTDYELCLKNKEK